MRLVSQFISTDGCSSLQCETGHRLWYTLTSGDTVLAVNVSVPMWKTQKELIWRKCLHSECTMGSYIANVLWSPVLSGVKFSDVFKCIGSVKELLKLQKRVNAFLLPRSDRKTEREQKRETESVTESKRDASEPNILKHSREKYTRNFYIHQLPWWFMQRIANIGAPELQDKGWEMHFGYVLKL